jgi:hypothetical protein
LSHTTNTLYEKSTWSVIYKLDELVYAVKLGKGGKVGGGVMRFRDGMMVEK